MAAAAEKTETFVSGSIAGGSSKAGSGSVEGVYTATIATTLDWIIFDDFTQVDYVHAFITATGVDAEAYIDGTTKNKVFITGTGAVTILVKGTPATV